MQHLHFDETPFDSGNAQPPQSPQGSHDSKNPVNSAGHGASSNSANNANASATSNAATDAFASWHAAPEDEHMIRLDGLPSMGFPYGGPECNYVNIRDRKSTRLNSSHW